MIYKIFRAVILTVILLVVLVPAAVYVVLSTDMASEYLTRVGAEELTKLLGTEVTIGRVKVVPFNQLAVSEFKVNDDYGKTALTVEEIDARFEFWHFITTGHIVIDYAVLNKADVSLYRKTSDSPLNIAGIIEKLKGDEKDKPPTVFDLSLYTLLLNDSRLTYNVLDKPVKSGFDINHLEIGNLNLHAAAPEISNDSFNGRLRHLSFEMAGGFAIENLTADVRFSPKELSIENLLIELDRSCLDLGNYSFSYDSPDELKNVFEKDALNVSVESGSYVSPADFAMFSTALAGITEQFDVEISATVKKDGAEIKKLEVAERKSKNLHLSLRGGLKGPWTPEALRLEGIHLSVTVDPEKLAFLGHGLLGADVQNILRKFRSLDIETSLDGTLAGLNAGVSVVTNLGDIEADGLFTITNNFKNITADARVSLSEFDLKEFTGDERLGNVSATVDMAVALRNSHIEDAKVTLTDGVTRFNGSLIDGAAIDFALNGDNRFSLTAVADVGEGRVNTVLEGMADRKSGFIRGDVNVENIDLYGLGLLKNYSNYALGLNASLDLQVFDAKAVKGEVDIRDFRFDNPDAASPDLHVGRLSVSANTVTSPGTVQIAGDFLNGSIDGDINPMSLMPQLREILEPVLPTLARYLPERKANAEYPDNVFHFDFDLDHAENLCRFFNVPIAVIYPIKIEGSVNTAEGEVTFGADAPYLMKGDMIIEQTTLQCRFGGPEEGGSVFATTQFPTKKGMMVLTSGMNIDDDLIRSQIDWEIQREKPIKGLLAFDTKIGTTDDNKFKVQVDMEPSRIEFGNDLWHFSPASVTYFPGHLTVDNFGLKTTGQSIKINGTVTADDPYSSVAVELENVVLNTIFETLDINKALIGGVASGTLNAGGIFSSVPFVTCDNLHVENIGYNNCVLGNGDVTARWDNDRKSFYLDAVISQEDGRKSYVRGDIFPTTESLDISFVADRIKVGFMKPFMDAFADDITGYASGKARIFGSFKYIDMEGDIYADELGLKVGFTNTWYYATDSIHIVPGLIDIKNVKVRDVEGHEALLNGYVKHNFFKDPVFDFKVTDANDFLCYDVTPALSPDWYGKIYGSGSAFITGWPGVVNIDVNMATAEGSTFTFVLSDTEEAEQYNFLTFRDKNRNLVTDSIIEKDILPAAVQAYRDKMREQALAINPPSTYNMNIQMDITPAAKVIIVMDPVGGDEIKSWGRGNMRLTYTSVGNELRMYGTYAIDRGSYNFTLQDIIVKDFIIREGSSITFTGDPYNASLDITASYVVNANLSDLDESFTNDPELTRTNVPVHALLQVKGDMRQPNIDFDLEFPTLTSDVYRKVRSIISTDEMMNRQMIYLLALNRFYTPEYMASTTKGNELFSVASSTISSRLSSMLGKLSENWSISPNLRSDKGDFSDVQFDVALSSNLLNNRLRMNGNFGYRDKSLNTTQFIGDFDLEYLLNRRGTWRLKAYNRFNDQTYFLRTAKTTQGVGIKFQREFDNMFSFLRRKKKNEEAEGDSPNEQKNDSTAITSESHDHNP